MTRRRTPPATRSGTSLGARLDGKGAKALRALLVDVAAHVPEAERWLLDALERGAGEGSAPSGRLETALLGDIEALDDAYERYPFGGGDTSDLDAIAHRLEALRERGEHDAVVRLGAALWSRAEARVESSDEDWEGVVQSLQDGFDAVFAALPESSLAPAEQLLWVLERLAEDEYSVLARADDLLKRRAYGREPWREAAAGLERRLAALPMQGKDFSGTYRRSRAFEQLVRAYAKAGWKDRIIPAMEAEVDASGQHLALVDALLDAGATERAREWCIEGHARTVAHAPGTASGLRERLREIAASEGRHGLVAAYRAQDFVEGPSLVHWCRLEEAARRAKVWPAVRQGALRYLETGVEPVPCPEAPADDGSTRKGGRAGQGGKKRAAGRRADEARADPDWPLPAPEVGSSGGRRRSRFPDRATLVDVALHEGRVEDALALYATLDPSGADARAIGRRIAPTVIESHPDTALDIWRREAEHLIAEVKPRSYEAAGAHLRRMREVLEAQGRAAEWEPLIGALRERHKAKRRLLEVLDGLSGKPGAARRGTRRRR